MEDEDEGVDFWRLRKSLREEYAFVTEQKRALQVQYASIVSTGDSLLRSLWIDGQQWRNLLRLRGGPKFCSECVYTANLLDAISFVDGYVGVGYKEVKYGKFLRELRDHTDLFKSILILADELNLETSAFVRTMLTSLYGSCLFPADQKAILLVTKSVIEYHLVFSQTPNAIFRTGRNSFSNILDVILHTFTPARAFLVSALKEVVFNILLDGSMFWTLEEQELLSVMAVSEVRQKFGDPGTKGTTERIKNHMELCWANLSSTIRVLLNKIKESLVCLPDIFLWIVTYFYKFSVKRGLNKTQTKIVVMRLLFDQIIAPSLLQPQPLLVDTEVRASPVAIFNLKKVVSILQTFISMEAGEDPINLAPEGKTFFDNLDRGPLHDVVDTLLEKLPKEDELTLPDVDYMPGIARTSVLITKTDLDSLVNFLSHLQHLSNRLLNQASLKRILSHLEGIDSDVTAEMNKMSISVESSGLQHELQDILQTFNKPFNENEEVLVISLGLPFEDCPGMLPEEKVIGMPSPKPKRKAYLEPRITNDEEVFANSQPSDSDSQESSSDEKLPELDPKTANTEQHEVETLGFEDSFVDLPSKLVSDQQNSPVLQHLDPLVEFDPLSPNTNSNDPFQTVGSQTVSPAPQVYSAATNLQPDPTTFGVLVDVGVPSRPALSPEPRRPVSSTPSDVLSDEYLNSSGSQSSTGSGQHSSGFVSSGSDGGNLRSNKPSQREEKPPFPNKKGARAMFKRPTPKNSNLQVNLVDQLESPKHEKKKGGKGTTMFRRVKSSRVPKKNRDAILNGDDVAVIMAKVAEQEKTAKDICDEIIDKYQSVKRNRSTSSLPDKPGRKVSDPPTEALSVSLDEEEVMRDAKGKLRLVLNSCSTPVFPLSLNNSGSTTKRENNGGELLAYLNKDLADAMATQDSRMVARLHETLSTLKKLPPSRHPQLLKELEEEHFQRKSYTSYLVRSRQGLIATREFLEKLLGRVERDREICRRYLVTQCVSMYLENYRDKLEGFTRKFKRLSMSDEKSEEMKSFLLQLKEEFQKDSLWLGSNQKQRSEAIDAVERHVIGRVYLDALYAFGETDKYRDDVFHKNVELLCNSIGEDFRALDIKEEYQLEAPWFPAQNELFTLSAYKTPKDKLKCIQRCCTTVMNLLAMSSNSGAVGADAFTPVLIYVVMHANPKGLLTTMDFINSYLSEPLTGEQYYCWMQFCSAIQFIKILLEENTPKPV